MYLLLSYFYGITANTVNTVKCFYYNKIVLKIEKTYHYSHYFICYTKFSISFNPDLVFRKEYEISWRRICFYERGPWRERTISQIKNAKLLMAAIDKQQQPAESLCSLYIYWKSLTKMLICGPSSRKFWLTTSVILFI